MEIGRFRTVAADDIRRYRYADDAEQIARDLRLLRQEKLVERRTVADPNRGREEHRPCADTKRPITGAERRSSSQSE